MKKILMAALFAIMGFDAHAIVLSYDDAVSMILTESQDLKKADANVKKAQAGLDVANSNRWFKLDASATYMNMINVENPGKDNVIVLSDFGMDNPVPIPIPDTIGMAGLSLTQPIYTFGKIGNAVDSARAAVKTAESGNEMARREVKYAAAQIYWTAKMTDNMVEIAADSLSRANHAKKVLTSGGRANRANLVKISADISSKEIQLADAKFNRDSAHRMLKVFAGIDAVEELTLSTDMPENFAELGDVSMNGNPEWDMLAGTVQIHERAARANRAGGYPTLAFTASYNYLMMHNEYDVWAGAHNQSANVGLALSVPLFSGGGNSARATMSAMDAELARQDLDKSKKLKTNEFNETVLKYNHLTGQLAGLKSTKDLAERAYKISADRFAAGQTSAVELDEVWGSVAQMEMAILNAKLNILMSAENIKKLAGE